MRREDRQRERIRGGGKERRGQETERRKMIGREKLQRHIQQGRERESRDTGR